MITDLKDLKTPCYVIDEALLESNLKLLSDVQRLSGAKILLAQKCYSAYATYPLISKYLSGTTASSLHEARLGYEEMGGETHIFAPAYIDSEIDDILKYCDHIVFNSFNQFKKHKDKVLQAKKFKKLSCGLRVNPGYSEVENEIYNPCAKGSRLGITLEKFEGEDLSAIDGLHFHTMCEQNSDTLERTLTVFEAKFSKYFKNLKWLNFGGGHHITREDYDVEKLISLVRAFKDKYNVQIYLEPGEAVALNAGYMVATILDIVKTEIDVGILDVSAACHMPDVIEMPYTPKIFGAASLDEKKYNYRFGGNTCLAGDIIGEYSFDKVLNIGDKLIFLDMAIYSMVKNNTFNGIKLPNIALLKGSGEVQVLKSFDYSDFKSRL